MKKTAFANSWRIQADKEVKLQKATNIQQDPAFWLFAVSQLSHDASLHRTWTLQNLSTDSNRSIATLASTTLPKSASQSVVDRLMKVSSTFSFKVRKMHLHPRLSFIYFFIVPCSYSNMLLLCVWFMTGIGCSDQRWKQTCGGDSRQRHSVRELKANFGGVWEEVGD